MVHGTLFSTFGLNYSQVCGQLREYHFVTPKAFQSYHVDNIKTIDDDQYSFNLVKFKEASTQLEDRKIYIGIITRSKLNKLLDEGDVSPDAVREFMKGARAFYERATSYALSHLPFMNPLLMSGEEWKLILHK